MAEYGSTDSGASLGDILGAALEQVKEKKNASDTASAPAPKKAAPKKKAEKEIKSSEPKKKAAKAPAKKKTPKE